MSSKKYPIPIIRGEIAHTTKEQCPSPSTESNNILVLQSGDSLIVDDFEKKTLNLRLINDCIGDKDEINEWIQKMKNGKFKNIESNSIEPAHMFDRYIKLSSDEFWYRFYCTFIYRDKLDGSYSILKDVDLRYISSLVIYDGQEYFYLTGDPRNTSSLNWEYLKERLEDERLFRQTDFSRCQKSLQEVGNVRALQLSSGIFNIATHYVPRFVRDSLITGTVRSVRKRIASNNVADDTSIVEIILPLTQTQEDLFMILYEEGYFNVKIIGKQKHSIKKILNSIQMKSDLYPSLRAIHSDSALKYHIETIERVLNKIHKLYVNTMINIEAELLYEILSHLRREYDEDKISFERKVQLNNSGR